MGGRAEGRGQWEGIGPHDEQKLEVYAPPESSMCPVCFKYRN